LNSLFEYQTLSQHNAEQIKRNLADAISDIVDNTKRAAVNLSAQVASLSLEKIDCIVVDGLHKITEIERNVLQFLDEDVKTNLNLGKNVEDIERSISCAILRFLDRVEASIQNQNVSEAQNNLNLVLLIRDRLERHASQAIDTRVMEVQSKLDSIMML